MDDDPDIRAIAELSLSLDPNFRVRLAESGRTALKLASEKVPDLILLDMMMPEMDGLDTFAALKEIIDPLPIVVFVTARTQPEDVARLIALGASGVIPKPFDPMAFPALVRNFVR